MSIRDGGDICPAANERQSGLVPNEPPQIPSTAFLMMKSFGSQEDIPVYT
jgi:hypothetical protein